MEKEERINVIKKTLQQIKDTKSKESILTFLRLVGVDEKIITNPNPEFLGTGLDFTSFLQTLIGGNVEINNDQVTISNKSGQAYLVCEGKQIVGVKSTLTIKNGDMYMSSAYQNPKNEAVVHNTSIASVEMQQGYRIRTKIDDYKLVNSYNEANNKNEVNGYGFIEIKDYDEKGLEVERHGISIHNNPTVSTPSIDIAKNQLSYLNETSLNNYGNIKEITTNVPATNMASLSRKTFVNTEYWDVRKEIDKVQNAIYDTNKQQWKFKYSLPLTGEHSMSIIRNNSESYSTEEELKSVQQKRLSEGWYDKKIDEYNSKGITGQEIASQLEQRKIMLEKAQGKKL